MFWKLFEEEKITLKIKLKNLEKKLSFKNILHLEAYSFKLKVIRLSCSKNNETKRVCQVPTRVYIAQYIFLVLGPKI